MSKSCAEGGEPLLHTYQPRLQPKWARNKLLNTLQGTSADGMSVIMETGERKRQRGMYFIQELKTRDLPCEWAQRNQMYYLQLRVYTQGASEHEALLGLA